MKKSFVPPSVIKQKARQLKKEKSLGWHPALDAAAIFYGFSNYKNYLNMSEENRQKRVANKATLIEAMYQEKTEKISKKLEITNTLIENLKLPVQKLLITLKSHHSDESIQSMCENNFNLKEYIKLQVLKDILDYEDSEIETFAPYHIAKELSVKNLVYRFRKSELYVEGDYDLKLEFAFNHDPEEKHDAFEDCELFGDFEGIIDKNIQFSIENSSIGENFDGSIYMASFR